MKNHYAVAVDRWRGIAVITVVVFLFALIFNWRLHFFATDDAFIHFRIASHLAHTGHGWFNLDQRVMATSSPLWTVLLAGCFAVFGQHAVIVPILNAIFFSATWLLTTVLMLFSLPTVARSRWQRPLLYAATFLMTFALLGQTSMAQMETVLAICVFVGGMTAFARERQYALALFVLAALTRYEMAIFLSVFFIVALALGKLRIRSVLAAIAVGVAGVAFLLAQYHTTIPNTVRAKAIGYSVERIPMAINLLWGGPGETNQITLLVFYWSGVVAAALLITFAATIRRFWAAPKELRGDWTIYAAFGCGGLLYFAYVIHPTVLFFWYRPVYTYPLILLILLLAFRHPRSLYPGAFFVLIVIWGCHSFAELRVFAQGRYESSPDFVETARVRRYRTIGNVLNTACPDTTLLSSEIGGLGDTFHGRIIDGFGLATPEAIQFQPLRIPEERSDGTHGGFSAGIVALDRPDIIVTYDIFARSFLRSPLVKEYQELKLAMFNREEQDKMADPNLWGEHAELFVFLKLDGRCHLTPADIAKF